MVFPVERSSRQFIPKERKLTTIRTADGVSVSEGDRVFDYYDGHWGTIHGIEENGWFRHVREDNPYNGYLNGERVCARIPVGNPFYKSHSHGNPKPSDDGNDIPVSWLFLLRKLQKDGMDFDSAIAEANRVFPEG